MSGQISLEGREWPMVGRDHEIDLVLTEYRRREVQGVVLTGAKGVGKSSLAAVAAARLADGVGCQVLSVGAGRALRSTPFAAIARLAPGFEDGYLLLSQLIVQFRACLGVLQRLEDVEDQSQRVIGQPAVTGFHIVDDASSERSSSRG